MKFNRLLLLLCFVASQESKAQVWYPEGVFLSAEPSMMTVDNQVITIGRTAVDAVNSYWTVSVYDGKVWNKLPILVLNKSAELTDIKKYQGLLYVSGNFTFDNGKYNALVRFNGTSWQGLGTFTKLTLATASITSLATFQGHLLLGGAYQLVNGDTLSYLTKFNGLKFSSYFDCKNCSPDNAVTDLYANDSVLAISGFFSIINAQKSKYLYSIYTDGLSDSFIGTPRVVEKLTAIGRTVYGIGGPVKDKHVYQFHEGKFGEVKANLDSVTSISELVNYEGKLVFCGNLGLSSSKDLKDRIVIRMDNGNWSDITNNYGAPGFIATGRGLLFAIGASKSPVSIWNPNRFVVRFYPGLSLVRAKAFIDSNNNCIWDSNEKPAPKQYIKLPFVNKGVFTNEDGLTEFFVPNLTSNTYRFVVKPFRNFVRSNCADTSVSKTFSYGQFLDSIQFPLKRVPDVNDIRVHISSPKGKLVLKNKRVVYYIVYENVGSNPIDGKIRLKKNKHFSNEFCVPAQSVVNDSTVEWSYASMQPGERKIIYYSGLPSSSEFDNPIQFAASVSSSISSGSSPYSEDDSDSIPQEVNNGISAFRKDVYPTPLLGDSITYLSVDDRDLRFNIAFNNFGTDTVFYAVIIDSLDLNLDMSYIQETGSNKSYYTEIQTDPNNNYRGIIIWHFPNIKLAPNPTMDYENMNSGAYIGFKVNTKPLSQGYVLKNSASVYFDNNYAGSTNAVYCTLQITDLDMLSFDEKFTLYPNPANGWFQIDGEFEVGNTLEVYNLNGQKVYADEVKLSQDGMTVDSENWPAGIYFIRLVVDDQVYTAKISIF